MPDMIARLRAERQGLVERLGEIDKILMQYEKIERAARQLLGGGSTPDSPTLTTESVRQVDPPTPATSDDGAIGAKNKTPIAEFEQAVVDVLQEADMPMDRSALYDALTARGIVIGDGDRDKELNALSARVYRMMQAGHLTSRRGQGYSLKVEEGPVESRPDSHGDIVSEHPGAAVAEPSAEDDDLLV